MSKLSPIEPDHAQRIALAGQNQKVGPRAYGIFRRYPESIVAEVLAHREIRGDCWFWQGPAGITAWNQWIPCSPAILTWAVFHERPLPHWITLMPTCGQPDCIRPEHQGEFIETWTANTLLWPQVEHTKLSKVLKRAIAAGHLATVSLPDNKIGIRRLDLTMWWQHQPDFRATALELAHPPELDEIVDPATDPLPGERVQVFERRMWTPWKVYWCLDSWNDPDSISGVFRTTLGDSKQCEQFTLLGDPSTDVVLVQVQMYKNGRTYCRSHVPCGIVSDPRKKTVTIELFCKLTWFKDQHSWRMEQMSY